VVRQGVQYLLARGSIRVLQIVGSIGIFIATQLALARGGVARFIPIVVGIVAIVLISRFSDRLGRWVDRRFFREAYNAEQILADLATQVRTIVETQPLLRNRVAPDLHGAARATTGDPAEPRRCAAAGVRLGYSDVHSVPAPAEPSSIAADHRLRAALQAELVLPLSANQKLIG